MTPKNKQAKNIAELNSLFSTLDDANQEYALILLQTLCFSQKYYEKHEEDSKERENGET
ncbi:hypothetical protein [Paenibacillus sp. FSL H8-0283]|uniref:hypothetical protein n=1 Tax=Paenibacillus sp. FSL H8-0283 TaxID=2921383 RepID=UPI003256606A